MSKTLDEFAEKQTNKITSIGTKPLNRPLKCLDEFKGRRETDTCIIWPQAEEPLKRHESKLPFESPFGAILEDFILYGDALSSHLP